MPLQVVKESYNEPGINGFTVRRGDETLMQFFWGIEDRPELDEVVAEHLPARLDEMGFSTFDYNYVKEQLEQLFT